MDEERVWAEVLATQAISAVALGSVLATLSRGDAERLAELQKQALEMAQRALGQTDLSGVSEEMAMRVHAAAEHRLDVLISGLGGRYEPPRQAEGPR